MCDLVVCLPAGQSLWQVSYACAGEFPFDDSDHVRQIREGELSGAVVEAPEAACRYHEDVAGTIDSTIAVEQCRMQQVLLGRESTESPSLRAERKRWPDALMWCREMQLSLRNALAIPL